MASGTEAQCRTVRKSESVDLSHTKICAESQSNSLDLKQKKKCEQISPVGSDVSPHPDAELSRFSSRQSTQYVRKAPPQSSEKKKKKNLKDKLKILFSPRQNSSASEGVEASDGRAGHGLLDGNKTCGKHPDLPALAETQLSSNTLSRDNSLPPVVDFEEIDSPCYLDDSDQPAPATIGFEQFARPVRDEGLDGQAPASVPLGFWRFMAVSRDGSCVSSDKAQGDRADSKSQPNDAAEDRSLHF